ncbi:MAG TPA: hypothetical protein VFV34_13480 [Blastocatellia bacterium]|nr:hypothetical protein [Blastocatellia bacterium]
MMNRKSPSENGFSYIDVLIAVSILLIGVMALVSAITYAVVGTTRNQQQLVAKQYASTTIEAIFTARDLAAKFGDTNLTWNVIGNTGSASVPAGLFPSGRQKIYDGAGADGIVGTPDDQAGLDGTLNTADDAPLVDGFERTITITDVPDPERPAAAITMRQIDVTIHYFVGGRERQEVFSTYIASFR